MDKSLRRASRHQVLVELVANQAMAEELSLESGLLRLITGHMMMSRSLKHSLYLPQVILWRALHEADQAKVAEHLTR